MSFLIDYQERRFIDVKAALEIRSLKETSVKGIWSYELNYLDSKENCTFNAFPSCVDFVDFALSEIIPATKNEILLYVDQITEDISTTPYEYSYELSKYSIIAWRLFREQLFPLTYSSYVNESSEALKGILMPDGKICVNLGETHCDTAEQFIRYATELYQKKNKS